MYPYPYVTNTIVHTIWKCSRLPAACRPCHKTWTDWVSRWVDSFVVLVPLVLEFKFISLRVTPHQIKPSGGRGEGGLIYLRNLHQDCNILMTRCRGIGFRATKKIGWTTHRRLDSGRLRLSRRWGGRHCRPADKKSHLPAIYLKLVLQAISSL